MSQTIGGRLAYADLLRCTAMLAVIVVHITGGALEASPVGTPDFMVLNVYDGLTHWCVPVFVMLSGMFLLDPKHSLPPSKLFFGHMLRIAAALAVWGTAYALVERVQVHGLSWESVRAALYQVLLGKTCFHLWFLYMLLGLYLVTPVLRAFVRGAGRGDFHWFFLLVFVFTFLLPTLLRLRPSQTVSLYQSYLNIKLVLGYVGYYVLGYYLKEYTLSRPAEYLIYLLGIAGAAVTVGGTAWLSQQRGALAQTFYNYDSPNIALMSTAVFVLFRYLLGVSDERSRRQRFSGVAKVSFGIYLVHVFFLMLLRNFGIPACAVGAGADGGGIPGLPGGGVAPLQGAVRGQVFDLKEKRHALFQFGVSLPVPPGGPAGVLSAPAEVAAGAERVSAAGLPGLLCLGGALVCTGHAGLHPGQLRLRPVGGCLQAGGTDLRAPSCDRPGGESWYPICI